MGKWLYYIYKRIFDTNVWMWIAVGLYFFTFLCPYQKVNELIYCIFLLFILGFIIHKAVFKPIWTAEHRFRKFSQFLIIYILLFPSTEDKENSFCKSNICCFLINKPSGSIIFSSG